MFQQFIRKAFVLFFVGLIIFGFQDAVQAQVCQPAGNGLVSWYRAEGDAADAQGLNHGSPQNGTTFAPGKTGQAFKFDGVDDFVEIPDSASLKPQNLTLEAWVKFDSLYGTVSGNAPAGFQYIVFKKNSNRLLFEGYSLIKLPNHRLAYSSSSAGGAQTTIFDATQTVEVGKYYHVVGTYDGATARLYVNGRKVAEQAHNLPLDYDTRPVTIGGTNEASWDGKMNGAIDEVRIYDRALTEAEISRNYAGGLSLINNCDAEADPAASGDETTDTDVSAWENETGEFTVVRYGVSSFPAANSPGPANRGAFFFAGGRTTLSRASQSINLAGYAARIDTGVQSYNLSGYLGGFGSQGDNARVTATFRNAANTIIGEASIGPVTPADRGNVTGLLPRSTDGLIPAGTRSVEIAVMMTRVEGTYNDGYADNLSFSLIQPAEAPANLAAWHGGDGDARDFTGANPGTPVNNPGFVVGKVGQAFHFQNGSRVEIDSAGIFRGQTEGTIEAWIRPRGVAVGFFRNSAIWVETEPSRQATRFGLFYSDTGFLGVYANASTVSAVSPAPLPLDEWAHVAATYRAGEGAKLYVNGVLAATSSNPGGVLSSDAGAFVGIGAFVSGAGDDFRFNGDIDEPSVYTRALSPSELQAIYNAGTAGKAVRAATGAGANVANTLRDATVTFDAVTTPGETSQTPLDFSLLPALPQGFVHTGLAYDISTTAVFSGNVNLCFNLTALAANANFPRLRVLHLENGVWVNRTTTVSSPQLCGRVSSLSPFVVAENLSPTSASVAVGGRVTASGRGVAQVQIALTDQTGAKRYALTNQFGYYRFADVPAGTTYVLFAHNRNYVFDPPQRVLLVNEELTNVDFTAQPNQPSLYRGNVEGNR